MKMRTPGLLLACVAILLASGRPTSAAEAAKPVKVFILAGQSNMEGKAKVQLLEYQAKQPATRELFQFKEAQAAGALLPEFQGNVALVKTDVFWDTAAEAVFKKGWREYMDEWNTVGSDWPYHYLGSAKTMCAIGKALGEAMVRLERLAGGETTEPRSDEGGRGTKARRVGSVGVTEGNRLVG